MYSFSNNTDITMITEYNLTHCNRTMYIIIITYDFTYKYIENVSVTITYINVHIQVSPYKYSDIDRIYYIYSEYLPFSPT